MDKILGMDFGKGDDLTTFTFFNPPMPLQIGDRLSFEKQNNRYRYYVKSIISEKEIILGHYIRSSRGYAKHIRRMKANARQSRSY